MIMKTTKNPILLTFRYTLGKTIRFGFIILIVLVCTVSKTAAGGTTNEVRIQRHVAVTMRDGVKLYVDLYLPAAPGRYPTIVWRTPMGFSATIRVAQQSIHHGGACLSLILLPVVPDLNDN
jgi:predicted acyl esterase